MGLFLQTGNNSSGDKKAYLERIDRIKLPLDHFLLKEIQQHKDILDNITPPKGIIGESEAIEEVKNEIRSFSQIGEPVLIIGESGTEKSFFAREIHKQSNREGAFLIINCQTIPPQKLDAEVFGDKSDNKKITGLLEKADKGTLLIKDVVKLPVPLQIKLARFIDEKRIPSIEIGQAKALDVKIIFTAFNNIEGRIASGEINRGFYDRISDFIIKVPPLRERRNDIRKLAGYFYIEECRKLNKDICGIQICAMNLLEDHPWPGNVRELQKTIRRCVVKLHDGKPISKDMVLKAMDFGVIRQPAVSEDNLGSKGYREEPNKEDLIARIKSLEQQLKKEQEEPPRTRITDSYSIINEVFRIIQEQGPVRKSDITSSCPEADNLNSRFIVTRRAARCLISCIGPVVS